MPIHNEELAPPHDLRRTAGAHRDRGGRRQARASSRSSSTRALTPGCLADEDCHWSTSGLGCQPLSVDDYGDLQTLAREARQDTSDDEADDAPEPQVSCEAAVSAVETLKTFYMWHGMTNDAD